MNEESIEGGVIRRCYICGDKFEFGVGGIFSYPGDADVGVYLCDGHAGVERDERGCIANHQDLWERWDSDEAANLIFEPEDGGARLFERRALDVTVHEARTGRPVYMVMEG